MASWIETKWPTSGQLVRGLNPVYSQKLCSSETDCKGSPKGEENLKEWSKSESQCSKRSCLCLHVTIDQHHLTWKSLYCVLDRKFQCGVILIFCWIIFDIGTTRAWSGILGWQRHVGGETQRKSKAECGMFITEKRGPFLQKDPVETSACLF